MNSRQHIERRAGYPEDAAALQRLQSEHGTGQEWTVGQWQKELKRSNGSVWLVESADTDQPVGYLVMWRVADRIEIVDLLVHGDWRRNGIAQWLVQTAIAIGSARGVRAISLEVRQDNTAARRLYEQLGFEQTDRHTQFYDDGQTALVLRRLLFENFDADRGS